MRHNSLYIIQFYSYPMHSIIIQWIVQPQREKYKNSPPGAPKRQTVCDPQSGEAHLCVPRRTHSWEEAVASGAGALRNLGVQVLKVLNMVTLTQWVRERGSCGLNRRQLFSWDSMRECFAVLNLVCHPSSDKLRAQTRIMSAEVSWRHLAVKIQVTAFPS